MTNNRLGGVKFQGQSQDTAKSAAASNARGYSSPRLKEIKFADLTLSQEDGGDDIIANLEGSEAPVQPVPDEFKKDVSELRRKLKEEWGRVGRRDFYLNHDGVPYRVSVLEALQGNFFCLRRPMYPIPRLDELGIPDGVMRVLELLGRRTGLLLLVGATGAGKTTTAYSLLQEYLLAYGDKAVSAEDPPEVEVDLTGFGEGRWYQKAVANGDFAEAMRDMLRNDPRYIFLGETRSTEVAQAVIRASVSGHLVLTTIHGGSVTEGIQALVQLASAGGMGERFRADLANGLLGVMQQKLETEEGGRRRLKLQCLFADGQPGIKNTIRDGNLQSLVSEIERQGALVGQGKLPVSEAKLRGEG